jgi:hypothetical protein
MYSSSTRTTTVCFNLNTNDNHNCLKQNAYSLPLLIMGRMSRKTIGIFSENLTIDVNEPCHQIAVTEGGRWRYLQGCCSGCLQDIDSACTSQSHLNLHFPTNDEKNDTLGKTSHYSHSRIDMNSDSTH